jgi:hypothetical protein
MLLCDAHPFDVAERSGSLIVRRDIHRPFHHHIVQAKIFEHCVEATGNIARRERAGTEGEIPAGDLRIWGVENDCIVIWIDNQ